MSCMKTLKCKNLFFTDKRITSENFAKGQCCLVGRNYIAYRAIIFFLTFAGFVVHILTYENPISFLFYLTHYAEIFVNLYLALALFNVALFWKQRKNGKELVLYDLEDVENSHKGSNVLLASDEVGEKLDKHKDMRCNQSKLTSLEKTVWLLYELSFSSSLTVTGIFWIFLFQYADQNQYSNLDVYYAMYGHAIVFMVMLMESIISRHPAKFMHLVYVYILGVAYVGLTYILHTIRLNYSFTKDVIPEYIYWFTNWNVTLKYQIVLCFGMFPVTVAMQSLLLGLHYVRDNCK